MALPKDRPQYDGWRFGSLVSAVGLVGYFLLTAVFLLVRGSYLVSAGFAVVGILLGVLVAWYLRLPKRHREGT